MSVRILYSGTQDRACFYDATTGEAFGPIFEDALETDERYVSGDTAESLAKAFLRHLTEDLGVADPRSLDPRTLMNTYARWRATVAWPQSEERENESDRPDPL
jgi:hypothetical protein